MYEVQKKFIRNFLTTKKYDYGVLISFTVIGICLILSNFYWDKSWMISDYLAVNQNLIYEKGEYWRLFSSSFIHGDLDHFLSNTLMLYFLTYFVSSFYGMKISVFLGFLMGMVINLVVISVYPPQTYLVGASGVIYYLWGFWLVLYVLIERHLSLVARILRVGAVFLILLIPTTYSPSTSYLAHYFGFLLGIIIGSIYFLFNYKRIQSYEFFEYRISELPRPEEYMGEEKPEIIS